MIVINNPSPAAHPVHAGRGFVLLQPGYVGTEKRRDE